MLMPLLDCCCAHPKNAHHSFGFRSLLSCSCLPALRAHRVAECLTPQVAAESSSAGRMGGSTPARSSSPSAGPRTPTPAAAGGPPAWLASPTAGSTSPTTAQRLAAWRKAAQAEAAEAAATARRPGSRIAAEHAALVHGQPLQVVQSTVLGVPQAPALDPAQSAEAYLAAWRRAAAAKPPSPC